MPGSGTAKPSFAEQRDMDVVKEVRAIIKEHTDAEEAIHERVRDEHLRMHAENRQSLAELGRRFDEFKQTLFGTPPKHEDGLIVQHALLKTAFERQAWLNRTLITCSLTTFGGTVVMLAKWIFFKQ